jgi:hypothetical protein
MNGPHKMKILDDILSSISGNTKTRISDPLLGAFIISWITCNWNHIGILIWGEGSTSDRIHDFYIFLTETKFIAFNTLFAIPALLTIFYLFLLPWMSLVAKLILEFANNKLHRQAVTTELNQINSQKDLNRARLLSNPDKPFLEESIKLELNRREEILEHLKLRTKRLMARALEAESASKEADTKAQEALAKAKIILIERSNKNHQARLERNRFQIESKRLRALQESNRFPSAYLYMSMIESGMNKDYIHISMTTAAEIVAAVFGYDSFKDLIKDQNFNNDELSKVEYIYYDQKILAQKLESIVDESSIKNENFTSDIIFDHVTAMFESLSMELITLDEIVEKSNDFFESSKYELFEHEELSSEMAISNTTYEEIYFEDMDYIKNSRGFTSRIKAMASGTHYKFESAPGQKMRIFAEVKSDAIVGENALGPMVFGDISGKIVDAYAEEEYGR